MADASNLVQPLNPAEVVRGQHHKFMLIPLMEHHSRWFDAGSISIAVEARALGTSRDNMVRGPSIHVFSADRKSEFVRFDLFGNVSHYHYVLNGPQHNVVWGYDPDANGPMLPWIIAALRDRLPTMLRRSGETELASKIERDGWDTSVLTEVERAAAESLAERDDDMERAAEGMAWMQRWKEIHPQFNVVD
jgi:hypothetical protein